MKNSLKQILRTPARTALFFLLMTAATLLLVFSASLLSETNQRIDEVESTFTTVGRVEQRPVMTDVLTATWENECWGDQGSTRDIWDVRVSVEDLLFEGVNYVTAPEFRPYYMVEHPDWDHTMAIEHWRNEWYHIFEFTALEDSDELGAAWVRVERVLLKQHHIGEDLGLLPPHEGEKTFFCQCGGKLHVPNGSVLPLEKGKRYIAAVELNNGCQYHGITNPDYKYQDDDWMTHIEYTVYKAPYSSQRDAAGNEVQSDWFPYLDDGKQDIYRVEEVTDDFYEEGGRGQNWLRWANTINKYNRYFPVLPVDKLHMLPIFQEHRAFLSRGREITQEEYDSGAPVCMVPELTLRMNAWNIGDKLSLPLLFSVYGPDAKMRTVPQSGTRPVHFYTPYQFSPISADGRDYEAFWEAEYEIVGTYDLLQKTDIYNKGDIYPDTILIPQNSVRASDENNIAGFNYFDGKTVTFQIENGTIDEFDAALRAAVPQAEDLIINYNDNGYTELMESLQGTRAAAQLLFIVGVLAAIAILWLLLYFFVVKEKKRTAVERSLGMSKRQCRVSLLAGILVLTILAAALGALGGAGAMQLANREDQIATETISEASDTEEVPLSADDYNPVFSMWAKADKFAQEVDLTATTPVYVYVVIPLALVLLVLVLSLVLIYRNLKIDPIYLLSSKSE